MHLSVDARGFLTRVLTMELSNEVNSLFTLATANFYSPFALSAFITNLLYESAVNKIFACNTVCVVLGVLSLKDFESRRSKKVVWNV